MSRARMPLLLPAALATTTLVLSLAGYVALSKGEAFRAGPIRFALSDGFEASAGAALTRLPPRLARTAATERSRQALALSPYNNTARLRLAYLGGSPTWGGPERAN
jgi:hypothetical protein